MKPEIFLIILFVGGSYQTDGMPARYSWKHNRAETVLEEKIFKEPGMENYESCFRTISSYRFPSKKDENELDAGEGAFDVKSLRMSETVAKSGVMLSGTIKTKTWRNNFVPYTIPFGLDHKRKRMLACAILYYREKTCVEIVPNKKLRNGNWKYRDYMAFQDSGGGCYSDDLGKKGGRHAINLQYPNCWSHGVIIHEINHALGLFHEQARKDRDAKLEIHWDNIPITWQAQYRMGGSRQVLIGKFDYESIMMYPRFTSFSMYKPTMTAKVDPKKNNRKMGNRRKPTSMDTAKINILYNCPTKFVEKTKIKPRPIRPSTKTKPTESTTKEPSKKESATVESDKGYLKWVILTVSLVGIILTAFALWCLKEQCGWDSDCLRIFFCCCCGKHKRRSNLKSSGYERNSTRDTTPIVKTEEKCLVSKSTPAILHPQQLSPSTLFTQTKLISREEAASKKGISNPAFVPQDPEPTGTPEQPYKTNEPTKCKVLPAVPITSTEKVSQAKTALKPVAEKPNNAKKMNAKRDPLNISDINKKPTISAPIELKKPMLKPTVKTEPPRPPNTEKTTTTVPRSMKEATAKVVTRPPRPENSELENYHKQFQMELEKNKHRSSFIAKLNDETNESQFTTDDNPVTSDQMSSHLPNKLSKPINKPLPALPTGQKQLKPTGKPPPLPTKNTSTSVNSNTTGNSNTVDESSSNRVNAIKNMFETL